MLCGSILNKVVYRLVSVYHPPGTTAASRLDCILLANYFSSLVVSDICLVLAGDFNLPLIDWELLTAPDDGVHDVLPTMFLDCRMYQILTEPK